VATTAPARTKLMLARRRVGDATTPVPIQVLAREAGLHPELVRRLVALGVLEAPVLSGGRELFPRDAAARLARIVRLRRDLGLNYAGAVLACELLARIDDLEARLRRYESPEQRRR
jgi:DNA-binding transcriptional MerR regulator